VRVIANHLSEVDLIRFLDEEMSAEESAATGAHLETCELCRIEMTEIAIVAEEVKGMVSTSYATGKSTESHHSLRTKLDQASSDSKSLRSQFSLWTRENFNPAYAYGALGFVTIAALFFIFPYADRSDVKLAPSLPIRALTPGMTRPVNLEDICASGDSDPDPAVSPQLQEAVFREYGIFQRRADKDFQVDYLISPQLGGTDDVRNLWPQSYKDAVWNAEAKDALERHLSRLVCEGKVSLTEAQSDIATDWIAAYQKYF
jgi:hypothetical protein